jgi:hypothetical protein
MRPKHVRLQVVIMEPGRHGRLVQQRVARGCSRGDVITVVARRPMSRSAPARFHQVVGLHGPSGRIVRFRAAAPMSSVNGTTRAVARWTRIRSIVTRIRVPIMVPGRIGRPVPPRVVWAQ